ncbi:mediator of RNA polymerase II transcription subunit 15-like [Anabas testudineus]|uniref:mediator of RNA polymerase II transcription subunit 15-like n=1 Tax=Anabas testudineus TaxID=64144 RepID=UPI000E4628AB|nr:mediator of RNA polymerase II transcription subunit 15-like [Anabas testudineus]
MEVPGPDSDWRSPQFRQKVVAQIEEAMRKAGTAHTKSSTDMENHVYVRAKTREEYLSLVARLIIHFRDIHKKALGAPNPMNALTNLTWVGGGPGAIGMGSAGSAAAVSSTAAASGTAAAEDAAAATPPEPAASAAAPKSAAAHNTTDPMNELNNLTWRGPEFRQKIVAEIEEAMRKAGTAHTKSSTDMENHVYVKAKTREEYLSLVARLIIHFRDIHRKALKAPVGGPGQMPMQQIVQAQQQQPQPMQFQPFQQVQQQQFSGTAAAEDAAAATPPESAAHAPDKDSAATDGAAAISATAGSGSRISTSGDSVTRF